MKRFILCAVALLSACAYSSGHHDGPNGKPIYYIDGMSAALAYQRAKQHCPKGYNIIGTPKQTTMLDYEMTVECK